MIIINANINQIKNFTKAETEKLHKDLKLLGVDRYVEASNVPQLLSILEAYHGQPICLFTNLSPNKFFAKNDIDVNEFEVEPIPNWRVPEYSFSAALTHHICQNYPIVGFHFITSALKRNINDCDLLNLTCGIKTTIQRKREWFKSSIDYNSLLYNYILNKTSEAISSVSILKPNHEILLRKPVAKFCQN